MIHSPRKSRDPNRAFPAAHAGMSQAIYRGSNNLVNLYRIMTDVCAGSHQRSVATGELGIVTLWVRAESECIALARAKVILTNKRYASIGRLSAYAEALSHDPLACETEEERAADRREDSTLAGYDAMKEQALAQADGLHEVWLGQSSDERLPQPAGQVSG